MTIGLDLSKAVFGQLFLFPFDLCLMDLGRGSLGSSCMGVRLLVDPIVNVALTISCVNNPTCSEFELSLRSAMTLNLDPEFDPDKFGPFPLLALFP